MASNGNGNGLDKTFLKSKKAIGFVVGLVALIGIAFGAMLIGIETTWTGIVVVVCAAAAAYDKLQTGCIIVDFCSAVTVDLVEDEGTLVGGAILPGLKMQLRALHEYTAALTEVKPGLPETPYGRNTTEAMQTGVCRGVVGAVRALVEAYAVMTRLPSPHRVAPAAALELLSGSFERRARVVGLTERETWRFLHETAATEVAGGRACDAQILRCAVKAGATRLLPLDRRDFARLDAGGIEIVVPA